MVDEITLKWARASAPYRVTPMRTEDGEVAPHYLDEISQYGLDFDELMKDAVFARVIDCELAAEAVANGPLDALAELAPSERVRELFLRWLAFMNADLQPWTTGGAIHFRPHWARVLMHALVIGEARGLVDADLEALAMAAVFHDSRRHNPYLDTGHGARAAAYYLQFCEQDTPGADGGIDLDVANHAGNDAARRTPAGAAIRFDPRTYLAIYWHDRDDDLGLAAIGEALGENRLPEAGIEDLRASLALCTAPLGLAFGTTPVDPGADADEGAAMNAPAAAASPEEILRVFKDADALDRVRLGGMDHGGLDVRFLRTPEARERIPFANELLHAVE